MDREAIHATTTGLTLEFFHEIYPLEQAQSAYERMMSGKARFRVVLKVPAA